MDKQKINFKLNAKNVILTALNTSLSFVRTALVCLSVAFAFMKIDKENPIDAFTIIMFVFSAVFVIWGIVVYVKAKTFCNNQEKNSE